MAKEEFPSLKEYEKKVSEDAGCQVMAKAHIAFGKVS
jgi:hypothetical protein